MVCFIVDDTVNADVFEGRIFQPPRQSVNLGDLTRDGFYQPPAAETNTGFQGGTFKRPTHACQTSCRHPILVRNWIGMFSAYLS